MLRTLDENRRRVDMESVLRSNSCAPATLVLRRRLAPRPRPYPRGARSGLDAAGFAIEGWASDIDAGRDAALYAYQRRTSRSSTGWPGR